MNDEMLEILLIEDNPGDVHLITEALGQGKTPVHVSVVTDGEAALQFLHRQGEYSTAPRPALILLDLNLPRKDGREVLAEIKRDKVLGCIPVVVLTGSEAPDDISKTYDLSANCYVSKSADLARFTQVVQATEDFWVEIARLPVRHTD
jgi:CheY-like chemotaxis protein